MTACICCGVEMKPHQTGIKDWEYGVPWNSELVKCPGCGLVAHQPAIRADQIDSLYPGNYLAHSSASRKRGIYGYLKSVFGNLSALVVAKYLPRSGTCLEVGCGNGQFLKILAALRDDIRVIGVDVKDTKIEDVPRFTFHHGQLEELSLPSGCTDVVYCSNLIEHVCNPLIFLNECHRILKPHGIIYGVTPDHLSLDRYIFGKYWGGYHYPRHTFVFDHDNIIRILKKAGFMEPTVRGGYSFWYTSFANRLFKLPGTKSRGFAFAAITAVFAPVDYLINVFQCHGSMTFVARKQP